MIKAILIGLWSCIVAVGAAYFGLVWSQKPHPHAQSEAAKSVKLTHIAVGPISVPVASNGEIKGYVVARFGYVSRADDLKKTQIKPEVFFFDAVFSAIYQKKMLDMGSIDQDHLAAFSRHVKEQVNSQLGAEIIQKVVPEQLGFVPLSQVRGRTALSPGGGATPALKSDVR